MKTIAHDRIIYQIHPWDPTPPEIKEAYETARELERNSRILIRDVSGIWGHVYNALRAEGKTKRKQSRVRFSDTVNVHCITQPEKVAKKAEISDRIGREIISAKIMEKVILQLLATGSDIGFSKKWPSFIGGTHKSLCEQLEIFKISMEDLTKDFKRIISYFENGNVAILGYRSSWKLLPSYDDFKLRRNIFTNQQEWVKTGKKFKFLPKFRLYLVKVIQDRNFAAKVIQDAWKKKKSD